MNRNVTIAAMLLVLVVAGAVAGGSEESAVLTELGDGRVPVTIRIAEGEHYLHRLKIMPLVSVRNPPQIAVWTETSDGFGETLYVTSRIARQEWRGAPGDDTPVESIRRPEALPVWAHRHGNVYADGLMNPTREEPLMDAVTSATPKAGFVLQTSVPPGISDLVVYVEINASTDFNDAYPKDARPGEPGYSGGAWGSGQPSLVYAATITSASVSGPVRFELIGHGSPDGSDGRIGENLDGVTTARSIVSGVELIMAR